MKQGTHLMQRQQQQFVIPFGLKQPDGSEGTAAHHAHSYIAILVWNTSSFFFQTSIGEDTMPSPGRLFHCVIFPAVMLSVTGMFHCAAAVCSGAGPGPGASFWGNLVRSTCPVTCMMSTRLERWHHLGTLHDSDAHRETNTKRGIISQSVA